MPERRYPATRRGPRLICGSPGTQKRHGCSSPRPGASPIRVLTNGAVRRRDAVVDDPQRAPREVGAVVARR